MATQPRPEETYPESLPLTPCYGADKVKFEVRGLAELPSFSGDAVVFACRANLPEEALEIDRRKAKGLLSAAVLESDFKGEAGATVYARLPSSGEGPTHLFAVGTGEHSLFDPTVVGAAVSAALRDKSAIRSAAICVPDLSKACPCPSAPRGLLRKLQAVMEHVLLDLVPDQRFKGAGSKSLKTPKLEQLTLFVADVEGAIGALEAARQGARGLHLCRELVNSPANICTTITLADTARKIAEDGGLQCRILGREEIEKLKMGSFLAVAKGSIYPPRFIHLTYTPKEGAGPSGRLTRLAFLGKGVCFDSGGYNIKRAENSIELMKFDMGGAAAVLGAARVIAQMKPSNVEVHFIVAAAENMVSSTAYRPGDVVTASNGVTIEVGNTDAEGRLTLADALVYAEALGVDSIVDIATLTGACVIALGESYAGLWSSDEALGERILECAERSGEKMWRMPLVTRYRELLESKCADINNVGGKGKGGAITAAVFLKEFVGKTPWAHIDIAGPAWCSKTASGTGYGVRTLVELARSSSLACGGGTPAAGGKSAA